MTYIVLIFLTTCPMCTGVNTHVELEYSMEQCKADLAAHRNIVSGFCGVVKK